MKRSMHVLCASLMIALSPLAGAQTSTSDVDTLATTLDATAANRGQTLVATRIASSFSSLTGSDSNSLALVNALRTGTNATLTYTTPATTPGGTATTTTATYDPPTGKMGWGNVKIALALAQDSLARLGITNPTADQLQAALNGGSVTVKNPDGTTTTTTLKGVLQMRADGMGWGQIAHASGTKLGPVVSGLKTTQAKIAALPKKTSTSTTTTTATSTAGVGTSKGVAASSKGIVTAAGVSTSPSQSRGAASSAGAPGRGMVTAAGGGASLGATTAASHGPGSGVVTATGGAATSVTTAAGAGNGNGSDKGKGHGNGKGGGG